MPSESHFDGKIKVASRIIDQISSGLYHAPSACLKELINNSYDADATEVNVLVKPDADRIVIEDNGVGFSKAEFTTHFDRVSESHKRDNGERTAGGRLKIGKIGIGFIAANELCETLEIYSTKKGSRELLHVVINFDEMRKPIAERRDPNGDVTKADYFGDLSTCPAADHFTQLHLLRVRGEARNILSSAKSNSVSTKPTPTLYGLTAASVRKVLGDSSLKTWDCFDLYSKTMLEVALNIPVQYLAGWIPESPPIVRALEKWCKQQNFSVYYDNTELRKPTVLTPPTGRSIVQEFTFEGENVSAQGYFYGQHGTVTPRELQGLLIRIRGAAVGEYDSTFLGFSSTEASLLQKWVSAEVWADDRLEEAMNIDRRTLREVHPAYVELRGAVHDALRGTIKRVRAELYQTASKEKKRARNEKHEAALQEIVTGKMADFSPSTARDVAGIWETVADDEKALARAFKSRTVPELYEIVLEAAREVLSPAEARKLIRRLTEKIVGDE